MRAIVAFAILMLACGSPAPNGNGNGNGSGSGNAGGGGGVGGAMSCATKGSAIDCTRACNDLDEICKNPSTMLCVDVCIQLQSYCAAYCKVISKSEDYALFGCLQASNDCSSFDSCGAACVTRSAHPAQPNLADMSGRD